MNGWVEGIQSAIAYVEENLTEELDVCDIAEKAYVSAFHFQKIFSVLCGFTIGEYIRKRRLTLAAEELAATDAKVVCGMYGICLDSDGKSFEYLIADNYIPWNEIPEGFTTRVIPAGTWAAFPCRGALPEALQNVNTKIWKEWLPNCKEYKLAGNYNIEMYTPLCEKPEDNYSEIWVPVEKI